MTSSAATIEFDVDVTLDDQLRFTEWLLSRPAWRRKRLLKQAAYVLLVPPLAIPLAVTAISFQEHQPFFRALRDVVSDHGAYQIIAEVAGLLLLFVVGARLMRRPRLRRRLRKLLVERPGIDPADPSLAERVHIAAGPSGCRITGTATMLDLGWPAVKSLDDAGTILTLMTGRLTGYIIPKRGLSDAQIDGLKAIVQANLAASGLSGEPKPHG